MPLQNRVTPTGDIVATPHRGLFTGNRGIIHDPATKTLTRRWASQAWLTCVCEFRGRRRKVMGARSWTELFFLDEATALAAGHRPCFYCRRDDADRFRSCWEAGQWRRRASRARHRCHAAPRAAGCAARSGGTHCVPPERIARRRDAAGGAESHLILQGRALLWTHAGYRAAGRDRGPMLLTPPSTLRALGGGYVPVLHPSAVDEAEPIYRRHARS